MSQRSAGCKELFYWAKFGLDTHGIIDAPAHQLQQHQHAGQHQVMRRDSTKWLKGTCLYPMTGIMPHFYLNSLIFSTSHPCSSSHASPLTSMHTHPIHFTHHYTSIKHIFTTHHAPRTTHHPTRNAAAPHAPRAALRSTHNIYTAHMHPSVFTLILGQMLNRISKSGCPRYAH